MSGLFLIGVLIMWLVVVVFITRWIARRFKSPVLKTASAVLLFPALLVAPLADELIGAQQFKALCEKDGRRESDFKNIYGKTVVYTLKPFERVVGTLLETTAAQVALLDQNSRRALVTYYEFRTRGGWLIRSLGISEENAPLTFNRTCGPFGDESAQDWADRYQIQIIFER